MPKKIYRIFVYRSEHLLPLDRAGPTDLQFFPAAEGPRLVFYAYPHGSAALLPADHDPVFIIYGRNRPDYNRTSGKHHEGDLMPPGRTLEALYGQDSFGHDLRGVLLNLRIYYLYGVGSIIGESAGYTGNFDFTGFVRPNADTACDTGFFCRADRLNWPKRLPYDDVIIIFIPGTERFADFPSGIGGDALYVLPWLVQAVDRRAARRV